MKKNSLIILLALFLLVSCKGKDYNNFFDVIDDILSAGDLKGVTILGSEYISDEQMLVAFVRNSGIGFVSIIKINNNYYWNITDELDFDGDVDYSYEVIHLDKINILFGKVLTDDKNVNGIYFKNELIHFDPNTKFFYKFNIPSVISDDEIQVK